MPKPSGSIIQLETIFVEIYAVSIKLLDVINNQSSLLFSLVPYMPRTVAQMICHKHCNCWNSPFTD